MIVCLDCGNSRIKWGVHDGRAWLAEGVLTHGEVGRLGELCRRWPQPERLMLSNVAGPQLGAAVEQALAPWARALCVVRAAAQGGGVTNLYDNPGQLGVDRWCALIGARRLVRHACLVVMAGTATTIDSLDAQGRFLGGSILPGLELMQRSLSRETAALPLARGEYREYPRCTDDAIVSGCFDAQLGAIERAFSRLEGEGACCILSGGNAELLAHRLVIPHRRAHNLPLEGLRQLALEFSPA